MRYRDLLRDINRYEQKLENVLLYVDFMDHEFAVILLKDGSLLTLFQLAGLDYEGLSEDEKEQFSHYARVALEQLPEEGAGFMLSNLLIRDTPQPLPLLKSPDAHPLIQFLQERKQAFWDDLVVNSFGNRILCGLRCFDPKRRESPWGLLVQENKLLRFYRDHLDAGVQKLEQGFLALASGLGRFGFRELDREQSDPAFSHWIALLARTGRHWNIMLDLITQSLADLDNPDQPWSKAIITNLKQAFFFPGQKDVEASFRKLQLTEYHIQQYKKLDVRRVDA